MNKNIKNMDILKVSSKIGICGLPIRCDTYSKCSFGCKYCFSQTMLFIAVMLTLFHSKYRNKTFSRQSQKCLKFCRDNYGTDSKKSRFHK